MTNPNINRTPFSIHLAVDGSQYSLDAAFLLQSLSLPPGSKVNITGVLTPGRAPYEETIQHSMEQVQQVLLERSINTSSTLLYGHTAKALLAFADENKPDLIVVGAHGLHATLKILLGGVAQEVVEYMRWPVLVVRTPVKPIRRVLLAVDGSPYSRLSANYLAQFPLPENTQVDVLHVLPPLPNTERLAAMMGYSDHPRSAFKPPAALSDLSELQKEEERRAMGIVAEACRILRAAQIETKEITARGDAANEIIEHALAKEVDLVVVGSRGLDAIRGWWWGSVSRKLVHYAPCSVLVVRGRPENN